MKLLQNRRVWRGILVLMFFPLALIAFWPSPVDQPIQGQLVRGLYLLHRQGVPTWVNYAAIEAAANIAIFIPLGIVSSLAFPAKLWWQLAALGMLVSGCIELGQLLFLHDRFATLSDVVTNTAGAALGALTVKLFRQNVRALGAT
ncbi:teicoplanin resistance protein VanZ [Pseudarthrobacter phenanthrenivorans]|uniref:Teicoplanin resistance protein VanZ n=2 Tax=Pseudarthrobacter phenanthrenivorans TaxID=361575 RepID=A0A0B4DRZ6_PSEPS|nr:teicoplanin resistance protein VanZ [Pseudarthrobacter phenanthrenivorans]